MALAAFLSACLLDSDEGARRPGLGYVRLDVSLERNASVLMKSSAADTTFSLDSMYIELTAPGSATQSYRYSIAGRPDTGAVTVSPYTYGLNPVRSWMAKIYTIDNQTSPARRDTVHFDSIPFYVNAGDTVAVNALVRSAVAILRVRLLSTSGDSLLASINYLRVRVNGVTRDSLFPNGATYNGVYFANLATAWAVSDSGWIYKTSDSGTTWIPQSSGIGSDLNSVWFTSTSNGAIVGDNGAILKTTNGGTNWVPKNSGVLANLRYVNFTTPAKGYAVGDGGVILKTVDSGSSWTRLAAGWFSQTSPHPAGTYNAVSFGTVDQGIAVGNGGIWAYTTNSGASWLSTPSGTANHLRDAHLIGSVSYMVGDEGTIVKTSNLTPTVQANTNTTADLYGVDLTDASNVWAVGENEAILRTINGGTNWLNQTGGWLPMTSGAGSASVKSINMGSATVGWMVGAGGMARKTTDGGLTWGLQNSTADQDLNTVFVTDANRATAVGNLGTIVKTNFNGSSWSAKTSLTSYNLRDIDMVTPSTGWAVGDSETVVRTNDSATWTSMPGGFTAEPTGVTDTILSIHFFDGKTGWAVGTNGRTLRTTNSGDSWIIVASGKNKPFRSVSAVGASSMIAVGDSGIVRYTSNNGGAWSTGTTNTLANLRASYFTTASVGFAVGDSGYIRRTANGGSTFATNFTVSGNPVLQGVHSDGTYVWIVGNGGVTYYKNSTGTGGSFSSAANAVSGSTVQLNDVYAITSAVVVAVGQGGLIRRTTTGTNGSGGTWATVRNGGENLTNVWFKGASDTGYAFGENGVILESVDAGATWTPRSSATGHDLKAAHVRPGSADSVIVGGENGFIGRSINGSINWTGQANKRNFTGVDFFDSDTGWVTSDDGRILKTRNGGARWVVQDNAASNLNGIYARDSMKVWAVGNGGMIRYSSNGGASWTTQGNSPQVTNANLLRVHFRARTDTGWAVGTGGVVLRTTNGGALWTIQPAFTTEALRGVFVRGRDTIFAAGDNGTILRTLTNGALPSGKSSPQTLKAVYNVSATKAFAVGTAGTIVKTVNGTTWFPQANSDVDNLNAVVFPVDSNTGYAAGAAGTILKTTNSGANWNAVAQTLPGGFTEELKRLHFTSNTHGWAVSASGSILRTTDGAVWTEQNSGTVSALNGVFAVNADSAFAVGAGGTILKTRSGNTEVPSADLRSVHFIGDTGFVVGQSGTALRTYNGGASWTKITGTVQNLNGVVFSKQTNASGYVTAVGDGGTLVQATLAGNTWTPHNSGTTQRLNAIHIAGAPRLYLVGDSGIIRSKSLQNPGGVPFPLDNPVWVAQNTKTTESLRGVNCFPQQDTCLFVGTNETVVKTDDGASTQYVHKSSGARRFDKELTYKALPTRKPTIISLQAIDRNSPLRGFEFVDTLTFTPGQDTTINVRLTQCGGTRPACTP
jgi:photosystem II stability/assembly factor-like uncharacterized protein